MIGKKVTFLITITYFALACAFFLFSNAHAQEARGKFGKNRVQYKNFNWRYYSTENFNIYFYDGGNEIAKIATEYLEKEFDRVTDLVGTVSYTKTEIFLYNSPTDLLQSNIGVNDNSFDVAGQTDFVEAQVEIAYPGSAEEFKKTLIYKVASMLIYDMMFGGSLSYMFQETYLSFSPEWFMDGAARYTAYGWDVNMDDFIRDMIRNRNVKYLNSFSGEDAGLIGQSIWNFIAKRYGGRYISNILNLNRIIRNEERSISGTIGIPFKSFIAEWTNYYMEQASFVDQNYILPDKNIKVDQNKKGVKIQDIKISPEGNYYTYAINNEGRYKVMLKRLGKKREKVILKGGYKVINQEKNNIIPILSWKDENNLGIIITKYGKNYMLIYEVSSGKKVKKQLTRINQVRDFDISRNGNLAVISADRNGDNDLYLISLRRNSIKRITSDFYDDINPRFVPGTSSIIFSSNRKTDSINVRSKNIDNISDVYNLFIYNIDSTKNTVYRITNMLSKNIKPVAVSSNEYFFISDQQGIFNLHKFNLEKKMYYQVSNFGSGIKDFDVSYDKTKFAYVMTNNGKDVLYLDSNFNLNQNIFTAQTKRQQYLNAKFVAQRLKNARKKKEAKEALHKTISDEEDITGSDQPAVSQSKPSFLDRYRRQFDASDSENLIDTRDYVFDEVLEPEEIKQESGEEDEEILDFDNYVFDTDVVKGSKSTVSFLSTYRKLRKKSDVAGPFPYEAKFSVDNIVASFVIDPLIGFGFKLETQLNDQLENHKFYGGILTTADLTNGSFYGEYRFLKHTVDFHARYSRKSLFRPTKTSSQKYTLNTYELGASLPFSVTSRLSLVPFFETTRYWDLDPSFVIFQGVEPATSSINYGGIKVEFIYDNTSVGGLNLIQGTRAKLGLKHNEGLNENKKSFSNVYLDVRNYQKLHRELVFATRLFYGRYWGPNPQKYLLGGMDNLLFNKTNDTGQGDPLKHETGVDNSNILFVEYVTSLRGFDYNTFNGTNSLLFNAELRLPVIKYFYHGPIASNFLRNLQFIGFYDMGSAWTGPHPFATEINVKTEIIAPEGSPFKARIQNFKNPWLASYGFGIRSVLLEYYIKFDVAYPIEDLVRKNPKFLVTLGYDF